MEIIKYFKKTEVGRIPIDWDVKRLSDLAQIETGSTPPTFDKANYGSDFLFVSPSDLGRSVYITDTNKKLSEKGFSLSRRFPKHSVLFTCIGSTIGKTGIASIELTSNQQINAVFPSDSLDYLYTYYVLTYYSPKIKVLAGEQAVPQINKSQFKSTQIPLPPTKAEQTAIATALSDADALIRSLEKLIAKKHLIKQGAMQELLKPKEGWVVKKLGEVGEITGSGVDKKINPDELPIRLVNYMDVFKKDFIYSEHLNHWVTAPPEKAYRCSVKKGDIFFTPSSEMRWDIAISAISMEDIPDAAYSYHLVRLRLNEEWDLNFRAYIFKVKDFLNQAETICEGSGKRYVISLSKFREMTICYPIKKDEQARIGSILYDIDAEIAALELKLEKYKQIKQGMMQNLLTGKIRLV